LPKKNLAKEDSEHYSTISRRRRKKLKKGRKSNTFKK